MKEIALGRSGCCALVDDEDFAWLSKYKWRLIKDGKQRYAVSTEKGHQLLMHRLILNAPEGMLGDHRDRNGLNNQRANLRLATPAQNRWNLLRHNDFSKHGERRYKGVKQSGSKWWATISANYQQSRFGPFDSPEDAARAYDDAARRLHGEFASLNFPASPPPSPEVSNG